ncbi:MAG: ribosome silencing factor [Treponema sp.]|jgi:ribosome-associated protein|nr:ribosome silencing factor [Treponema sp.]
MDDTFPGDDKNSALAIGGMIREHKGGDVVVMDLRGLNSWTDFFVIATVTSYTHMQGLQRNIKEFAREWNMEILRGHRKQPAEDEWNLIDMGNIVIHLMTAKSRAFYELERLWSAAEILNF